MWWTWCVQAIPVDRNSFQCHILINLPFEHSSEHSHYIWVTETLCKPHKNALKQCRNPQYYTWNVSGDHILALSSLSCSHWNITNLNTECIWVPKEVCTHCQHSTEWWPRPQEQEGHWEHPIREICVEFICICSTSVTGNGGKLSIA